MRKLSDTIARLAAFRGQGFSDANLGDDRLFELKDFGSNLGALRVRAYIPDDLPDAAPLVVVLHGCTQNAAASDHGSGWSTLADQEGFALLFPEQQRSNNAHLCFNWFEPGDVRRSGGEALSIRQMVEALVVAHGLDRSRIFVTGLSAGGAMTSVMLATYPEIFAGGAIIAGLPYGAATNVPEAFDRMRGHGGPSKQQLQARLRDASLHKGPWPTISIWHGSADHTVASSNAEAILEQWSGVHGVSSGSARSIRVDGHLRRVWCDATGREVIEEFTIAGMGHGTPLATTGEAGLGVAGPFMLEAGISSTRHIAQFWGIAKPLRTKTAGTSAAASTSTSARSNPIRPPESVAKPQASHAWQERVSCFTSSSATRNKKIIEEALRAAGLMREN